MDTLGEHEAAANVAATNLQFANNSGSGNVQHFVQGGSGGVHGL